MNRQTAAGFPWPHRTIWVLQVRGPDGKAFVREVEISNQPHGIRYPSTSPLWRLAGKSRFVVLLRDRFDFPYFRRELRRKFVYRLRIILLLISFCQKGDQLIFSVAV